MLNTPFSPWPSFSPEEADAVRRVLLSNRVNYWTGQEGRDFEKEFAAHVGTGHAVAVANGSVALDLALAAVGIGVGDEVIVTPRTFVASASSTALAGAVPVFADVDANSENITPGTVAPLIGPKTKAIVCVHHAGWPCDMRGFRELAGNHGLKLVEDCAQAHGATYHGASVGSLGDIAAWSFCQDKIITTGGEGGMVTTDDRALWQSVWSGKDHGKSWQAVYATDHPPGFRWLHHTLGNNFRLTEMQSAIGRIQLGRLEAWSARRRANAEAIREAAGALSVIRVPDVPDHIGHARYKLDLFVNPEALRSGWSRDRIMNEIVSQGVPCFAGSCPEVYREKAFMDRGFGPPQRLAAAVRLGETCLTFLVHPTLTANEIEKTCEVLSRVAGAAKR